MIVGLTGLEILDSRGRPTVQATCHLASGATGVASVPSGASRGKAEARELRDEDPARYGGLGCRAAVRHIDHDIQSALANRSFPSQRELDRALIDLDGTTDKGRLGANAILAVSLAFARAMAAERDVPLYQHFAQMLDEPLRSLPRPTINLFSGGAHAGGQVAIQDVLVVPQQAHTIDEALAATYAVYQTAARRCFDLYGSRPLVADEGGLAPSFPSVDAMLGDAVAAIAVAGFEPGRGVALAVDIASSQFFRQGHYHLGNEVLAPDEMIERLLSWAQQYPIVSVEDGLAEEDWSSWSKLRARLANQALVVGDDLLCTNPQRIERAITSRAADTLLLKVNQIGTLTEAADAYRMARSSGWRIVISARSGETEDDWLADLAVGWAGDYIKIGSITRSERLAKYNRLLAIEHETHLPLAGGEQRE